MRKILLLAFAILLLNYVQAQTKTKQEKGFFNITNIAEIQYLRSIDSSVTDNGMAVVKGGFEAHTINGYFLNPKISLGLGLGIQFANIGRSYSEGSATDVNNGADIKLMPIFADFRYYPRNRLNSPMFILDVGYAVFLNGTTTAKNDLNGGPLVKFGAGYKIYLSDGMSFVPALTCRAQRFGENTVAGAALSLGFIF